MMKKSAVGVFVLALSAGACLVYQATKPSVEAPPREPASGEVRPPKNQALSEESARVPETCSVSGGVSAASGEAREGRVMQARSTRYASSKRLLRQIDEAMQARDPAARDRFRSLVAELVRNHPEAAARFAESLEAGGMREEALRLVTQGWTEQDPASTERWATQLSDQSERVSVLSDMCFEIAQTNAAQAMFKAEQYGLGATSGNMLENLLQQWGGQDFYSAANWAKQQPEGEQRDQMLSRLAIVQSATAPAEAVQLVVDQIPPGPVQTEAAISVLHQWALHDLEGARSWAELFPAGPVRDRANTELANIATYQDRNH